MPNRCSYVDCREEPLNPAVPACDEHLCGTCRSGVIVAGHNNDLVCMSCYRQMDLS